MISSLKHLELLVLALKIAFELLVMYILIYVNLKIFY